MTLSANTDQILNYVTNYLPYNKFKNTGVPEMSVGMMFYDWYTTHILQFGSSNMTMFFATAIFLVLRLHSLIHTRKIVLLSTYYIAYKTKNFILEIGSKIKSVSKCTKQWHNKILEILTWQHYLAFYYSNVRTCTSSFSTNLSHRVTCSWKL